MGFKRSRVRIPPARYFDPRYPGARMFYLYILRSGKTGWRHVGSCEDIDERLRRHNAGQSKVTRHGLPWTVLHAERFSTRVEAVRKERFYKTGRGRDELD